MFRLRYSSRSQQYGSENVFRHRIYKATMLPQRAKGARTRSATTTFLLWVPPIGKERFVARMFSSPRGPLALDDIDLSVRSAITT